jgi:hypothetical protein
MKQEFGHYEKKIKKIQIEAMMNLDRMLEPIGSVKVNEKSKTSKRKEINYIGKILPK